MNIKFFFILIIFSFVVSGCSTTKTQNYPIVEYSKNKNTQSQQVEQVIELNELLLWLQYKSPNKVYNTTKTENASFLLFKTKNMYFPSSRVKNCDLLYSSIFTNDGIYMLFNVKNNTLTSKEIILSEKKNKEKISSSYYSCKNSVIVVKKIGDNEEKNIIFR